MSILFLIKDNISNSIFLSILTVVAITAVLWGVLVITIKNPIVSVLFLIGLFLSIAVYLLSIGVSFIGLAYILVYVGAVSILFLFILMLINVRISEIASYTSNNVPLAILIGTCFFFIVSKVSPRLSQNKLSAFNFYSDKSKNSELSSNFKDSYDLKQVINNDNGLKVAEIATIENNIIESRKGFKNSLTEDKPNTNFNHSVVEHKDLELNFNNAPVNNISCNNTDIFKASMRPLDIDSNIFTKELEEIKHPKDFITYYTKYQNQVNKKTNFNDLDYFSLLKSGNINNNNIPILQDNNLNDINKDNNINSINILLDDNNNNHILQNDNNIIPILQDNNFNNYNNINKYVSLDIFNETLHKVKSSWIFQFNPKIVSSNSWTREIIDFSHIISIGNILYTSYPIWLILTSFVLLLAMIGTIVITIKFREK